MKIKGIIGILLVVPCLLKLATMWGLFHISWLEGNSMNSLEIYVVLFVMLYVGIWLIVDGFRNNHDQWLQRPLPVIYIGGVSPILNPSVKTFLKNYFSLLKK